MGLFCKFCSETTIHGLCHIAKEQPFGFRLLWFMIFLSGLSATALWYYNTINLYISNPTSTEFNVVRKDRLLLPKIMICTANRFNGSKVRELNISEDLISVFHQDLGPVMPSTILTPSIQDPADYEFLLNHTWSEYQNLKHKLHATHHHQILDILSPKCQDIVLECTNFMGDPIPCCPEAHMYWLLNGWCTVLPEYEVFTDHKNGIQFVLKYPNASELVPGPGSTIITDHQILILRSENLLELDVIGSAAPGKYTSIMVEKVEHISVNKPPNFGCVSMKNYFQKTCHLNCMMEIYHSGGSESNNSSNPAKSKDVCSFENVRRLGDTSVTPCDPWTKHQLSKKLSHDSTATPKVEQASEECSKKCLPPCEQQRYKSNYVFVSDFSKEVLEMLWKDPDKARAIMETRGILVVSGKVETDVIHQRFSMTLETLVGNLGGSLGLFLGGSLASLVHIVVYVLQNTATRRKKAVGQRKDEEH